MVKAVRDTGGFRLVLSQEQLLSEDTRRIRHHCLHAFRLVPVELGLVSEKPHAEVAAARLGVRLRVDRAL